MNRPVFRIAAAGVLAAVCVSAGAEEIDPADLYDLPPADVVILGEVHDNPVHHAHQAIAVEAVGARAVVFEMLSEEQALRLGPGAPEGADALGRLLEWEETGWPAFDMYYPVFVAARDAEVFGGALPRDEVRRAVTEGAAAVFGDAAALFGLDAALPEGEQAEREAGQMAAHCDAMPEAMMGGMVEAQRLRDAALARAVLAALAETGGPVAVITGNGHARLDWGLAHALRVAAPEVGVLSVAQFEETAPDDPPHDLWLVTEAVEREDPCAAFADR